MEEPMAVYKSLYYHLFNAVTDSIAALDRGWTEAARALLIRAQQDCEEQYMDQPPLL